MKVAALKLWSRKVLFSHAVTVSCHEYIEIGLSSFVDNTNTFERTALVLVWSHGKDGL